MKRAQGIFAIDGRVKAVSLHGDTFGAVVDQPVDFDRLTGQAGKFDFRRLLDRNEGYRRSSGAGLSRAAFIIFSAAATRAATPARSTDNSTFLVFNSLSVSLATTGASPGRLQSLVLFIQAPSRRPDSARPRSIPHRAAFFHASD